MIRLISKILFISLVVAAPSAMAIQKNETVNLRNGAQAPKQRVEKVWNALSDLYSRNSLQYYWLWRTAKKCRELGKDTCVLSELFQEAQQYYLRPLEPENLAFLETQEITHAGILDKETQDIILSSYNGSHDPKLIRACHPVKSWKNTGKIQSCFNILDIFTNGL